MTDLTVVIAHNRYRSDQPSGENTVVDLEAVALERAGVRVVRFEKSSDDIRGVAGMASAALGPVIAPAAVREFAKLISSDRPDVVHVHNLSPLISPWVVRSAHQRNIPVVQTVHNFRHACIAGSFYRDGHVCTECASRAFAAPGVVHGCYRGSPMQSVPVAIGTALHRRTWQLVDRFLPVSQVLADFLIDRGFAPQAITVKPNFMPDPGAPTAPGRDLLFAGRLSEDKGVRMLLDAWQAAPPGSGALRIAGDGPLRREVEDRAKAGHNVQYLGILRPEQVSDEVTRACAVVVPSLWHETFGMGVIDAFRHGRPVIATRMGNLGAIVDDSVGWTIASTTEGLAEAIIQARIPEIAQPKGASARRRYESDYSPDRVVAQLVNVYREVVRERSKS